MQSAVLYIGHVRHRRFHPKRHDFTYPVYMAFLDLDDLDASLAASALVGRNRLAWASFHDRDYGPAGSGSLKSRYREDAERQGFTFPEGRVFLLTNLRILGYGFNPVSYVYVLDDQDRVALIGAEVTNTPWKERITYWMKPSQPLAPGDGHGFDVTKGMHVSPFMPMGLRYRWSFTAPTDQLLVRMALFDADRLTFDADLVLASRAWTPRTLRQTLLRFPFITFKVIAAIHWEALRLWIKRVPVFTHPSKLTPPGSAVSPAD